MRKISGKLNFKINNKNDEDWLLNIYQCKKRIKTLINWCKKKDISEIHFAIILDEVINGSIEDIKDGEWQEVSLKERILNEIK